jgi:hypothetical protein
MYVTQASSQMKEDALLIYHEIISSIANGVVLDWPTLVEICETVDFTMLDSLTCLGYVKVKEVKDDGGKSQLLIQKKYLNANPQLFRKPFGIQNGIGIIPCSNGVEDSYKGQILLPLQHGKEEDEWLCIEYEC